MCTSSTRMAVKLKKQARHVGRWPRGHANLGRQGTRSILESQHVSSQGILTCQYLSTQDMMRREARNHTRHDETWGTLTLNVRWHVRDHISTQGTLAREHARKVDPWALKRAIHVDTWARERAKHAGTQVLFWHAEPPF